MKTVFVSGGAEGQGYLLAKALSARGWRVFAGVLPGARTEGFGNDPNITSVPQNVADPDSVIESVRLVEEDLKGGGLDLLLNVAGIANVGAGPLENARTEDLRFVFEVNTFGQLRLIQGFLPALRRASPGARIMNYASGAVIVTPPCAGIYTMSKHAIHGMTLTLRGELAPFGIQVTTVMPGGVLTNMSANSHKTTLDMWEKVRPELRKIYEPFLLEPTTKVLPDLLEKTGSTPQQAVDAAMKLLDIKRWKSAYTIGNDAKALLPMHKLLPESMFEGVMRSTYKVPALKTK